MDKQTYDLAITFGRFNLLHNGHLDLFRRMADAAHECSIGVSSGPKNLPLSDRIEVIKKGLGDNAGCYHVTSGSNPFDFFDFIQQINSTSVILFLGEDQEVLGKATQRVLGWDYHLVKRLGSSTDVRGMIDREEWDRLVNAVPAHIIPDVARLRGIELSKDSD
jgi:cytidyltransferase-like protein